MTPTPASTSSGTAAADRGSTAQYAGALEAGTVRGFMRHVMPGLCLMYLAAYIDRSNIGFAKLQMQPDLHMGEAVFTLGASLFFVGYFIFEIPSNLILAKVGARRWFARIMISWGLVTIALAFTRNATMFYILRFALGACEAGFFPGVLYLLTLWVPQAHRGRMTGLFMIASMVSNAIGAPLCGALLDLDGTGSIWGWQWMFIVTGIPPVLLGGLVLRWLPDGPREAHFLTDAQKDWLDATLRDEAAASSAQPHAGALSALRDVRVLFLAATYIGFPLAAYGLSYWLPTVVKGFGVSNTLNGAINVLPWLSAAIALWAVPRAAAAAAARRAAAGRDPMAATIAWVAIPAFIGALALAGSVVVGSNTLRLGLLCVAAAMILAPQPVYWSIPSAFLDGARAAAGLATINAVGNLGGFVGQNAVGWVRSASGSTLAPMLALSACLAIAALLVVLVRPLLGRHRAATLRRQPKRV